MNTRDKLSYMDIGAIEELYKQYKENPENVDESFRFFFEGFDLASKHYPIKPQAQKYFTSELNFLILQRNFLPPWIFQLNH